MKILIDSYNNVMQHDGGGVQMRIRKLLGYYAGNPSLEAKLFDKWADKLHDFDILHEFKDTMEPFSLFSFAKEEGVKVVLSSVIAQEKAVRIKAALALHKLVPFHNSYSLMKRNLCLADAIIPQTNKEAAFIHKYYGIPMSKMHVIPNGVNEAILDSYSPTDCKDIVLCVGRFDHNKNQLSLIRAAIDSKIEVHFVGGRAMDDGAYYDECVQAAQGFPNIVFHGWLSNTSDEFLSLYKRARVVALVSHHEIFGNSLIEGAACGANLLATDVLPTEEWGFDEHCVKVNVSDPAAMSQGLKKAYELPLDSFLHDVAVERFSWQQISQQHVRLYQRLLESRND